MKRAALALVLFFLSVAGVVWAANGHDLSWNAVGSGGRSAGRACAMSSGVVQPAGVTSGGGYSLQSGFWSGAAGGAMTRWTYLPVLVRASALP